MVRAILEGRKTVTRRLVKPQPSAAHQWQGWILSGERASDAGKGTWGIPTRPDAYRDHIDARPPYETEDRLYVRETFTLEHCVEGEAPPFADRRPMKGRDIDDVDGETPIWVQPHYRATDPAPDLSCDRPGCAQCRDHDMGPHWVPSIHMPKWASRIWLEVISVRVERLHAITGEGCLAEGAAGGHGSVPGYAYNASPMEHFRHIWQSINGNESWADNPWVWVVEFRRIPTGGLVHGASGGLVGEEGSTSYLHESKIANAGIS